MPDKTITTPDAEEKEYCGECLREGVQCRYPDCLKEKTEDGEHTSMYQPWLLP